MFDYGQAPTAEEVEITVFGPGYGEAICVHMGDGSWLLVDSCISPQSKAPASLEYLERIGVPYSQVHTIVASHWHDDHVKGLSEIVKHCTNSDLYISGVFNQKEALAFLSAYGGSPVAVHTAGAKELVKSIDASANPVHFTLHKTLLWEDEIQGKKMRAVAFSPTPEACAQSLAHIVQLLPNITDPIKHVVELKPNLEAIVITIDLDGDAILLGSDLEDHGALGWTSIVSDAWCLKCQQASVYKIAHHGSPTGDLAEIWSHLLIAEPSAVLTPFINGSVNLPGQDDKVRIAAKTKNAYMSSDGTKKAQMDASLAKQMGQMAKKLVPVNTGFGAVRFRKKLGEKVWGIETFGQARRMA